MLELSLGNQLVVKAAVAHALSLAGRDTLPESGPELLAFVRAHMVNILTGELGPRLTIALLDDLAKELDPFAIDLAEELPRSNEQPPSTSPPSPPFSGPREIGRIGVPSSKPASKPGSKPGSSPSSRPVLAKVGVLLIDPDRVGRTSLARALVRAHSTVTVVDTTADLDYACESGERFDVALVDAHHQAARAVFMSIAHRLPHLTIVARSNDATTTRTMLADLGFSRFDVRSRDAPAEELIEAMRRVLDGA